MKHPHTPRPGAQRANSVSILSRLILLAAFLLLLGGTPAQADVVLTYSFQPAYDSGTDDAGMTGSTMTFKVTVAQANYATGNGLFDGDFAYATPSAVTVTVSGSSVPANNGTFALTNTGNPFAVAPSHPSLGIIPLGAIHNDFLEGDTFEGVYATFGPNTVGISNLNNSGTALAAVNGGDAVSAAHFDGATIVGADMGPFSIGGATFTLPTYTVTATGPIVVNSTADDDDSACSLLPSGDCTLREAIHAANGDGVDSTITFDSTVFATAQTITLGGTQLPIITTNLTITGPTAGVTVDGNDASRIFQFDSGTIALSNLTLKKGLGSGGVGGGAIASGAVLTMTDCTFDSNAAGNSLGGALANYNQATAINCTFVSNSADGQAGGAIVSHDGKTLNLTNCTFTGNHANNNVAGGGAIINGSGLASITHCTIFGNIANNSPGGGGGIINFGTLNLGNSIVSGNTSNIGPDIKGVVASQGFNLIGSTADSSGFVASDLTGAAASPLNLGALANNGGLTQTMALGAGSVAIDKGSAAGTTTDQRGLARPSDYPNITNASGGDGSDIGAVESQAPPEAPQGSPDYTVNNTTDISDGTCSTYDCSLREAINAAELDGVDSTITFDATVFATAQTITLGGTQLPIITTNLTITGPTVGVTVDGNNASRVLRIDAGTVNLSALTIANGAAEASPDAVVGGGILHNAGTLTVTNSTFTGNHCDAGASGGGAIATGGTLNLNNCTLNGNHSNGSQGGGIAVLAGATTLTNCTLSGNSSGVGGGILNNSTLTLANCTFAGNNGTTGGALASGGTTNIGNTILKTGTTGANVFNVGTLTSNGFNLSDDATGPNNGTTDLLNTNPLLAVAGLADNGGPTRTIALQAGSPAIDEGNALGGATTDQRGLARPKEQAFYANAAGGDGSDIGAYEEQTDLPSPDPAQSTPFSVNKTADTADGVCGTSDCTLREAITAANADGVDSAIVFDGTVFAAAQTIQLTSALPDISTNTTITGTGAKLLSVRGEGAADPYRIFNITAGIVAISDLTVTNGYLTATANFSNVQGAGIKNAGTLTLTRCSITENHISAVGLFSQGSGIGVWAGGPLTVDSCTISGNTSSVPGSHSRVDGGGISIQPPGPSGNYSVTNSTISGNIALGNGQNPNGGGIYVFDGPLLALRNSTITGNTAVQGAGICIESSVTVGNCLFANNTGGVNIRFASFFGTFTSLGYNLSSDDASTRLNQATDQNGTDPLLAVAGLADNGGPTKTIALQSGSPALDKGKALGGATTDQRGEARPKDHASLNNAAGGDGSDIGAFELQTLPDPAQTSPFSVNKTSDTDDGVCGTSDCTLREAINAANGDGVASAITFDATTFATAQTITLGGTQLPDIDTNITITGPAVGVTIDANNLSTIVWVFGTTVNFSNLSLINGTGNAGGALYSNNTLTLTNCTLSGNHADGAGKRGGAIRSEGTLTLTNCTLSGNSADGGGGGGAIFHGGSGAGPLTLSNCTLSGNHANNSLGAGAVGNANATGSSAVSNCTFSGNSATASTLGGGSLLNTGTITIGNSIFAGVGGNLSDFGTITSNGFNLSSDHANAMLSHATDQNDTDPLLAVAGLADNGGLTKTIALQPGSPAINAGSNALIPGGVTTDQRGSGFARIKGGTVDIGAFESPKPSVAIASPTHKQVLTNAISTATGTATGDGSIIASVKMLSLERRGGGGKTIGFWDGETGTPGFTATNAPTTPLPDATNTGTDFSTWSLALPNVRGIFILTVQATDADGFTATKSVSYTTNDGSPTVGFLTPLPNKFFTNTGVGSLTSATGTAGDTPDGIAGVTVSIFRNNVGGNTKGYWNGATFDASYDPAVHEMAATDTGTGFDTWSFAIPTLGEGGYTLKVTATDTNGGNYASSSRSFTVDDSGPSVTIVAPANNSVTGTSPSQASGTSGGGVTSVRCTSLYRTSDGGNTPGYWTGTGTTFNATNSGTSIPATGGTAANWTQSLPTLTPGKYRLQMVGTSAFGRIANRDVTFTVNDASPLVAITSPTGATVTNSVPFTATGTASDGDGIASVKLTLFRTTKNGNASGYWTGTGFTNPYNPAAHDMTASNTGTGFSTWSVDLPALDIGGYTLTAVAKDTLGNYSSAKKTTAANLSFGLSAADKSSVSFDVVATAATLDSISASASASSVFLEFTNGAPSTFTVKVNGNSVTAQTIKEGQSVTLLLPDNSLKAGDIVSVTWSGGGGTVTVE